MDTLIYDRQTAVPLNLEDLNRIEDWTRYLADYLQSLGYEVMIKTRVWTMASIPWQSEIDRIRRNVSRLYRGYHSLPDWREITYTNSLDFGQVNAVEWDLHRIYIWLNRMVSAFWHCGEFFCGGGVIA